MDFKNSYRVEAVYFNKLKSDIDIAKSYIAAGATDEARAVLENLVDVDGAVLLLYRNIGECWAELANAIEKTKKELDALRDQMEAYHDELNEKIDEINNYIIRLINALDDRLTAAEADIDDLQDRMTQAESDIDDLEANKQDKLTAGFGIEIDANNEISVDTDDVQEKLTAGFGIEIDANNEISVDTNDVQEKLIAGQNITLTPDATDPTKTVIEAAGESYTAGFGIDIDANNEISVDTNDVQEKLIAGQNITLTPDTTDPTKTVIDAAGETYTKGSGISINNNVISASQFPYETKVALAIAGDTTKQTGSVAEYYGITWKYSTGNPVPIFTGVDKTKVVHGRLYINLLMEQSQTVKDNVHSLPLNSVNVDVSAISVSLTYTDENNSEITKSITLPPFTAVVSCIDFGGTTGKVFRGAPNPYQITVPLDGLHDYSVRVSFTVKMNSLGEKSGGGTFQQEFTNIYNNIFGVNVYFYVIGENGLVIQ